MATANDLVTKGLRRINVFAPGETLPAADANDALDTLNDLLDSLSNDQASIFADSENLFTFVPGQYQYTIGNYTAGTFGGNLTNLSATITGVTPPALLAIGSDISGASGGIPAGTTVLAVGATTVTMSAQATQTVLDQITYTVPGNFKMERPLRITQSFTRVTTSGSSLDYPIDMISQPRYIEKGYKGLPSPWPTQAWYNPTMPLGNIYFYPAPNTAAQLHLFADNILTNLPLLTTSVNMPKGYSRFLTWLLAKELAPEYGKTWTPQMEANLKEARSFVEALNQSPAVVAKYDSAIRRMRGTDAGWYLSGGFR